ncbi:hypothetical protein DSLASN_41350 [Desulfoluna limicola]|uniref:Type II secretion system protein H n=1 Tax=Desulfoluna limicola TaxID=2810562 RepID=A0ABN6FC57_9BACT|nr:GspH/FimT family pseudopilin [Desulfoluna limicola]BCS98503.1 hypothetical protein DSLASN_41350 [Desulfoluna limicola]
MPIKTDYNGFTLLELMVAVAIITIVSGLAIPEFSRWVEKQRLAGDARHVHGLFQEARSRAILTGSSVVVNFSTGKGESGTYLAFIDVNGNESQDSEEATVASGHVSCNTTITASSFDPNGTGKLTATHTSFNGMGLATGRNGKVSLADSQSRTATITLGPAGTSSVCTGS